MQATGTGVVQQEHGKGLPQEKMPQLHPQGQVG